MRAIPIVTYILRVVHNTAVVIWNVECADLVSGVLSEVVLYTGLDVGRVDGDECVSVWSCLLVLEADGVSHLVDDDSFL